MNTPETERDALRAVMAQAEIYLSAAHAEICKLQSLDPAKNDWPESSSPPNTKRCFATILENFGLK